MTDRSLETLEFQRDLLSLSGMASETVATELNDLERLVQDIRQAMVLDGVAGS
jgi:hypothetical protein